MFPVAKDAVPMNDDMTDYISRITPWEWNRETEDDRYDYSAPAADGRYKLYLGVYDQFHQWKVERQASFLLTGESDRSGTLQDAIDDLSSDLYRCIEGADQNMSNIRRRHTRFMMDRRS